MSKRSGERSVAMERTGCDGRTPGEWNGYAERSERWKMGESVESGRLLKFGFRVNKLPESEKTFGELRSGDDPVFSPNSGRMFRKVPSVAEYSRKMKYHQSQNSPKVFSLSGSLFATISKYYSITELIFYDRSNIYRSFSSAPDNASGGGWSIYDGWN